MKTVSMGRRVAALFVDWVIAVLSAGAIFRTTIPPEGIGEGLVASATFIVETALLTGLLGVTFGKLLLGLRVEAPDGRPIGVPRALVRSLLLSLVIPAAVMNDDRRGLHDIAAGSRVIRT